MAEPRTPIKEGREINDIARCLRAKWNIDVPVREDAISPSKINRESTGEHIFGRIKYLYWTDKDALGHALYRFQEYAKFILVEWNYKRPGSDSTFRRPLFKTRMLREEFLVLNDKPQINSEELAETLHTYLKDGTRPTNASTGALYLRQFILDRGGLVIDDQDGLLSGAADWSSPDTFSPTQGMATVLEELGVEDVPIEGLNYQMQPPNKASRPTSLPHSSDVDIFMTPPSSPSKAGYCSADNSNSLRLDLDSHGIHDEDMMDISPSRNRKIVPRNTAASIISRKRCLQEAEPLLFSPKVLREDRRHQPGPFDTINTLDSAFSDNGPQADLDSLVSSMTTATTRTANTSFSTDTAATSFTSDASILMQPPRFVPETDDSCWAGNCRPQTKSVFPQPADGRTDLLSTSLRKHDIEISEAHIDSFSIWIKTPISQESLLEHLLKTSPFAQPSSLPPNSLSFREVYETTRVALHCGLPASELFRHQGTSIEDYDEFWYLLTSSITSNRKGTVIPERSKGETWRGAAKAPHNLCLSGSLTFRPRQPGPIFDFKLKPLGMSKKYHRLARKFGGDRFCTLGIPGIDHRSLPECLRRHHATIRNPFVSWLIETEHHFLGRIWRAFFLRKASSNKGAKSQDEGQHQIYLFATQGHGLAPMTISEVLDWFMPIQKNTQQPALKLFARLSQALSDTYPTVHFKPHQIVRTVDAFADSPGVRRLAIDRIDMEKNLEYRNISSAVMNDGCARMSRAVSVEIARQLGLFNQGPLPCAYQGRLCGAKGVWIVDTLDEMLPEAECPDFWIEVTNSQEKFVAHDEDTTRPDRLRVMFEVHGWSKPLVSNQLNFQFIPILINRGVPYQVFANLLRKDLNAQLEELSEAMKSGRQLKKWNQQNNPTSQRLTNGTVEYQGGLPISDPERINWFVEHGFEPNTCRFLNGLCKKTIECHSQRLEDRMHISIGRSTCAFMIADPLAVLEENEVHIGFSNAFRASTASNDPGSAFQDTMLNDMEVLVARSPSHLPSDIQKVRAVFKPQLSIYKDVIIFSSKGTRALADKLSGGDYDGDRAWICWEPEIVEPFINADVPPSPKLNYYGIEKDNTRIVDMIDNQDFVSQFLRKGFDFGLQPNLLGICTVYHETLCYKNNISDPISQDIGLLLGHLVDSVKGGLLFTEESWTSFKARHDLPIRFVPPKPAYKSKDVNSRTRHAFDELVFDVARGARYETLQRFRDLNTDLPNWDPDLRDIARNEEDLAVNDKLHRDVLQDLKSQLNDLSEFWSLNTRKEELEGRASNGEGRSLNGVSFNALLEQARDRFLNIKPLQNDCSMVTRWTNDEGSTAGSWLLLKASMFYYQFHRRPTLPWYICGKELGLLKARKRGDGHVVVEDLYIPTKLDMKMLRVFEAREKACGNDEATEVDVEDLQSRMDEWDYVDDAAWDDWL